MKRREFVKNTGIILGLFELNSLDFYAHIINKKYKVALLGCGWYGTSDLLKLMQVANIEVVALCDVDSNNMNNALNFVTKRSKQKTKPQLYTHYEQLLANHEIDITIIGTPDHWHSLMMIDSLKAGSHIYLQKPISVDVYEGEAMIDAAKKSNKIIQVGLQRRSTPHIIEAKKNYIDSGILGKIKHVDMCCYYHMRDNRKIDPQPIPSHLDWDKYCGPAPLKAYDGIGWRSFMEFGNGIIGDMCVHWYDTARWMLNLGWPKKITSTGGIYMNKNTNANIADTQTAIFEHDDFNCVWTHRSWGTPVDKDYPWALFLYGEYGTLKVSTTSYDFEPLDNKKFKRIHREALYEKKLYPEDLKEDRIELHAYPATRRHFINMLECINNNSLPVSNIYEAHISTAACILANLSMELGRPMVYDPIKKVVKNDEMATEKLKRAYRDKYIHPYKS